MGGRKEGKVELSKVNNAKYCFMSKAMKKYSMESSCKIPLLCSRINPYYSNFNDSK